MVILPFVIGGAVAADTFAAGVWLGHRWGASSAAGSLEAAVKEAVARATTLPAGGIPAVAQEVADGVTSVAHDVSQVAQAGSGAAQSVTAAATDVHAALNAALAAAHASAPK